MTYKAYDWTNDGHSVEDLFAAGLDNEQISERLGIQPDTVRRKIYRLGLGGGRPASPQWPEEKVERLKTLWDEGLECSVIGTLLGTTRNAIIGKVHRLGLAGRKPRTKVRTKKSQVARSRLGYLKRANKSNLRAAKRRYRVALKPSDIDPPLEERIQFSQLTNAVCRFPIGDPKHEGFAYCGRKSSFGTPYCSDHHTFTHRRQNTQPLLSCWLR